MVGGASVPSARGGHIVYAGMLLGSSLLSLSGTQRAFLALLTSLGLSDGIVGTVAGITNLGWYDAAYLIGRPIGIVGIFDFLPAVAACAGVLVGALLFLRRPLGARFAMINLYAGIAVHTAALGVVLKNGAPDVWRLGAMCGYLASSALWLSYFRRSTRQGNLPAKRESPVGD